MKMGIEIDMISVGSLEVNCYIVSDSGTREAVVIDPGDEPDRIRQIIDEHGLMVRWIVCTHAHFDHVGAIPELKASTGAPVAIHEDDQVVYRSVKQHARLWGFALDDLPPADRLLREGDILRAGSLEFKVMHTPGHSPGCICLFIDGIIFTGDTVFAGSVGRTDFPGGNHGKMKESFRRILSLPDDTKVYPGHGPATSVGREKKENFFVSELEG